MSSGSVSSAAASSTTSAGQLSPGSLQPTTSTPNVVGSRGRLDGAAELAKESNFSAEEIQRLYKRFMKMDKDRSGAIDKEEFLSLPQIANNPLAQRLMAIFDEDGGGDIDFKEFIKALSVFSAKGNKLEKLRCELLFTSSFKKAPLLLSSTLKWHLLYDEKRAYLCMH